MTELFPPAIGGSAVLFEQIYSRLEGSDVTVLTRGAGSPVDNNGFRIRHDAAGPWRWDLRSAAALRQHISRAAAIRTFDPDSLVHCGRALPEGLAALLSRAAGGPRYACWAHGEELRYAAASRELSFLARRTYAGASVLFANSSNTAAMLEDMGVPKGRTHVVHPGVDPVRFNPSIDAGDLRRRFAPNDGLLLLTIGRLQRRKGHDVALAAVASLRERIPNLRYVIAGDGDERARLEQIVASHGLTDIVSFTGEVSAADLPRYMAACDVFLMPNRDDNGDVEGFGIVFLEAAACGKPVIGGRSGGVAEAIADGATGLLVDGTDRESVAAAIECLARSEPLRRRFGSAGRQRVLRSFTWDAAAATVAAVHARFSRNEK